MPRRKDRDPQLWERQLYEPVKAFAAFENYLYAAENRSITKTANALGRSRGNIADWTDKHKWGMRVRAWDDKQAYERRQEIEREMRQEAREFRRRHLKTAKALEVLAALTLKKAHENGDTLPMRLVPQALKISHELVRLALDEPGRIDEVRDTAIEQFDFSGWSEEKLAQFVQLYREAKSTTLPSGEQGTPDEEPPPVH